MVVLVVLVAVLVVAGMAATAAVSRDTARRRREWRAHAAEVRLRNELRAEERDARFGIPAPRRSREDSGYWLVDH
jgi:type II secretory pathway pseudopilin PulG